MRVRNYKMTMAFATAVALGMQSSRFDSQLGRGNGKTYYGQGHRGWRKQVSEK